MNRIYRLVWNRALRVTQVASELAHAQGSGVTGEGGTLARQHKLVAAICGVLGIGLAAPAMAAGPAASLIQFSTQHALTGTLNKNAGIKSAATPGGTGTTFTVNSQKTVTTSSGQVDFNSFSDFNVAKGDTVDLDMTKGTKTLVNLVWGESNSQAMQIYGTVNSYANGQTSTIGGSVYFADPYGIVVGAGGVLNVGALSLSAPSMQVMTNLLGDANGATGSSNTLTTGGESDLTSFLQAQEALADGSGSTCADGSSALICVDGTINATNAVRIHATTIDVSGNIDVSGKGTDMLATAVNVAGSSTPEIEQDGDTIRLIAEDDEPDQGLGKTTAASSITLSNATSSGGTSATLTTGTPTNSIGASTDSWGLISLTSNASATAAYTSSEWTNQALEASGNLATLAGSLFPDGSSLASEAANKLLGKVTGDIPAGFVQSSATANVSLANGTSIDAAGNVTLESSTGASSTMGSGGVSPSVMYGSLNSQATTDVAKGAAITSAGKLSVLAETNNTLNITASSTGANSAEGALAWSQIDVNASATVDAGSTIQANALDIGALNSNVGATDTSGNTAPGFSTTASATTSNSGGSGSVGLAGAVSQQSIAATANLGTGLGSSTSPLSGNVTIAAESDTDGNVTSSSTGTANPPAQDSSDGSGSNLTQIITNLTDSAVSALPFKLGSAVAYTDSDNAANATISPDVAIYTAGNVAVQGIVYSAGIHNGANSTTTSSESADSETTDSGSGSSGGSSGGSGGSGGSGSGSAVNVSAAVAYGNYQNSADAEIGSGDQITAQNIGVNGQVVVPFDWTFGQGPTVTSDINDLEGMGDSLDDFTTALGALKNLASTVKALPNAIMNGTSGFAAASSSNSSSGGSSGGSSSGGGTGVDIGGAVNYFGMNNTSRAWVGSGSTLTSTASAPSSGGSESWTSTLDWLTGAVDDQNLTSATDSTTGTSTITWGKSIDVLAGTHVAAFNLVGDLSLWSTNATTAAFGGAFNYGGYDDSATAGVDADTSITSNNTLAVNATGADTLFVLSPISGKGGSVAMQGTVALTDVTESTHATLSGSDTIDAGALDVNATNPVMVWALSGAVATSSEASVGLSVGINNIDTSTVADIGDNSGDESPTPATALAETGGTITTDSLAVNAATSGEAGSLSVAGTSVSSSSSGSGSGSSSSGSGSDSGSSAPGSGLISMLKSVTSIAGKAQDGVDKLQDALGKVDEMSSTEQTVSNDLTGSDDSASGSSLLDTASNDLGKISSGLSTVSSASSGLSGIVGKLGSLNKKSSGSSSGGGSGSGSSSGSSATFGIGVSGAASVDMASLDTQSGVDGVTVTVPNTGNGVASLGTDPQVQVTSANDAQLYSAAGAAALVRAGQSSSANVGLAGTVAYSNVADNTTATIGDSGTNPVTTIDAGTVAVQAVDSSMQVDAGIGAAASTGGSGTNVALAGSVSIGASNNQTTASVDDATLTGTGAGTDGAQVTAYDASEIGIGAGALSFSNGSGTNVNGALSLTWAQIKDDTDATVDGGSTISNYGSFSLNALDTAQIVAVAATGSLATGENGLSLTGAVTWSDVENGTVATVDGGANIGTNGNISVLSEAIDSGNPLVTSLGLPTPQAATSYYDFSGNGLSSNISAADSASQNADDTANSDAGLDGSSSSSSSSTNTTGIGNSIIAVAGDLSSASNDVGMSLAYNHVANSHQVVVDDATLASANGSLDLDAQDDTRIIGIALGVGVSTGDFAGIGSATVSSIANQDQVSLGSASASDTTLTANTINANASDSSSIYTLAGGVGVSTNGVGAGAAVTYNSIGNTIGTEATDVAFTTNGDDTAPATTDPVYDLGLQASNSAKIMAGAVAVGAGDNVGLSISFGWNQTSNTVEAGMSGGSLVNLAQGAGTAGEQGTLGITATDDATIQALSGSVGLGGTAGAAAAASVQEIGDSTQATLAGASLQTDDVTVDANTTATEQSIALGATIGGDGSGTASVAYNCIGDGGVSDGSCSGSSGGDAGTQASVSGITGAGGSGPAVIGNALNVGATDGSSISTLAVDVAGGGDAAVGAAVGVSAIGTTTAASIGTAAPASGTDNTLTTLDVGNQTNVDATSNASIESLAVGAAVSGDASLSGSATANSIDNTISASMTNVSTGTAADPLAATSSDVTSILATNNTQIGSLAGALAGSGSVALGAAVAVNEISTNTTATFDGDGSTPTTTLGNVGDWYQTGSLIVDAAATNPGTASGLFGSGSSLASDDANIQTIAVAGAAAGTGAAAGSVAINQIGGNTNASIGQGANVVADDNVGVLAASNQGINVYAGAAGLGGDVGVGVGVVVNTLDSNTNAYINDSDVNADANGAALTVANGTPTNAPTVSTSLTDDSTPSAPDLDSATTSVYGLAVNASNEQHAYTLSVGVGASGGIAGAAEVGVNQIGGNTEAYIDGGSLIDAQKDTYADSQGGTSSGSDTQGASGDDNGQLISSNQQVNVTAYNAQYASNYLMAAAGSGGVSVTAAAPVNTFNGKTKGYIDGSTVDSQNATNGTQVQADSYQWSLNNVGGVALAAGDGAAAANLDGTVSLFQADTDAYVNNSNILANNFSTLANSQIQSAQVGGALAVSVGEFAAAGSGMALVDVDSSETSAEVTNMQSFVDSGNATVQATSSDVADARGGEVAAALGIGAGLAGTVAVNILQDSTTALVQNDGSSSSNMQVGGALSVDANSTQSVNDNLGALGLGAGGLGGDINVTLVQTNVLANIADSDISAGSVGVNTNSTLEADNQATSVGVGGVGVGVSVGVLIAGTGSALNSSGSDGNVNWLDDSSGAPTANDENGNKQTQVGLTNVSQFDNQGALGGSGQESTYTSLGVQNASGIDSASSNASSTLGNALAQTATQGINARITGSTINANGPVGVTSNVTDSTSNEAGAGAGGAAAVGASVAYTSLQNQVGAQVDGGSTISGAQGGVTIQSSVNNGSSGDAAHTAVSTGGSAGNVTVGALAVNVAVAESEINNTVTAEDAGNISGTSTATTTATTAQGVTTTTTTDVTPTGGTLSIAASDGSSASAGNDNPTVTVGAIAAQSVTDTATRNDTIDALLDAGSQTSNFNNVDVDATDNGGASATGVAGSGGIVTGSGAVITAQDNSNVVSSIGDNGTGATTLTDVSGTSVDTDAAPTLSATADTTTVGVGVSVGVNDVNATADINAQATVGKSGNVVQFDQLQSTTVETSGNTVLGTSQSNVVNAPLSVESDFAPNLSAYSTGNSGGIVAVEASDATASSSGSNNAEIGSDVMLPLSGVVSIMANSTPVDSANSKGVIAGGFIGGGFNANAESDETTTASLDGSQANVTGAIQNTTTGVTYAGATDLTSLGIDATSTDTNNAYVESGSGELAGGVASTAATTALSTSSATLGGDQYLTMGGEFNLTANTHYIYGVTADSSNGAVVGGSGAYADNTAGASGNTAAASIGANTAVISGGNLNVIADTTLSADADNGGATSGAGGLFVGTAAETDNSFTANNDTNVGNGDYLTTYGYDSGSTLSSLNVLAYSTIQNVEDQASITIGGAVPVANPTTNFTGNVGNTINVDGNSDLSSYVVNIGTYANMSATNTAIGNSYGVAGVASASSTATLNANQAVNVGTDGNGVVNISSMTDSYVLAGDDFGDSQGTQLDASPVAQAYVRGLIAIPAASATANVTSNATMTLGAGSRVTSDGDVDIGSMNGGLTAGPDSEGHGYELGFIPVTNSDNSTHVDGSSNTTLNGTVVAGTGGDLQINIDTQGNLTSNALDYGMNTGGGFTTSGPTISGATSAVPFFAQLVNDYDESDPTSTTGTVTAWEFGDSDSNILDTPLNVRGGNVYLFGGNGTSTDKGGITGTGTATANAAPSITIDNASADTLVLAGIDVSFGLSGTVYENSANTSGATSIGGIGITQAPSTAQPNITIDNSYVGTLSGQNTPDIMVNGAITNFGGNVSLSTSEGSITTNGIYANDVSIYAPRGNVTFNANPAFTGGDPAGALDSSSSWLFTDILGPDFFNTGNAATGSWDADKVAAAIMESVYAPNSTSTATLNAALMNYNNGESLNDANYSGTFQATPIITIGNCAGFSYGGSTCGGPGIGYGTISEGPNYKGEDYTPMVPWIALSASGSNAPGVSSSWGTGQKMPSSQSQTLTVNAGANGYIDFDSSYTVGQSGVWTVQTQTGLSDFLNAYAGNKGTSLYSYNAGNNSYTTYQAATTGGTVSLTDGAGNTLYYLNSSTNTYEPLLGLVQSAGSSQLIGATYDTANKQIDLDSVDAAGGGQATLIGHVVSTGNGSITVNSGYGEVLVDNTTGVPLQVNNIDTGKASPGMVTIEDYSQLIGNTNTPTTTWYVSVDGGATQTFTNNASAYNSAQSGVTSTLESASSVPSIVQASNTSGDAIYALTENGAALTGYAPAQGQYYNYGMTAAVFRQPYTGNYGLPAAYTGSSVSTDWSFYNAQTGKAENGDQAWTPYSGFSTSANEALNNGAQWAVGISGNSSNPVQSIYAGGWAVFHGCSGGLGTGCNYGTTATMWDANTTWYSSKNPGGWGSAWNFLYPDYGTLSINVTQSASLPIAINFATSTTNRVEIDSNANILLNGVIANTNNPVVNGNTATGVSATPDTLLVASNGGNILNVNQQNQQIWTHDLAMIAEGGGSIGTPSMPINVQITGYGNTDSSNGNVVDTGNETTVTAITDGFTNPHGTPGQGNDGSINLSINAGSANQPILAVAGGNGMQTYGDVNITSTGTGSLVSTNSSRNGGVVIPGLAYLGCLPTNMAIGGACSADVTVQTALRGAEDIVGNAVNLTSGGGIFGSQTINGSQTIDTPLMVQTHFSSGSIDTLNLNATGDIDVTNDDGDYEVGSVVSQSGNVIMDAEKGGIYDASSLSASATLNPTQEEALWERFGLVSTDTSGNAINAPTAVDQSITSEVNAAYSEYTGLLAEGTYNSSNGSYTFSQTPSAGLLQSYWPQVVWASNGTISASATPDQADVQNYLAGRIASDITLFKDWISTSSASWNTQSEFTSPGNGYVFALTSDQQTNLASKSWSENALLNSLSSAGMLTAPSTSGTGSGLSTTTVGTDFTPNISGVNVTLLANGENSGLGQLGTPITIDEGDLVTLYSKGTLVGTLDNSNNPGVLQALASANTPGDITVYDTSNNVISGEQLAQLAANASLASVGATSGGTTIGSIQIKQIDPLFVDVTGDLAGAAKTGTVYIQAKGNLALATQKQGDRDTQLAGLTSGQDMNLTATGSIQADPDAKYPTGGSPSPLLTVGGNLTIAATDNVDFGQGDDPLPVDIKGQLNKGSAGENLALVQTTGDLLVNQAIASGDLLLQSLGGSIYAIDDATSIAGNQITLKALDNIAWDSSYPGSTPTIGALWVQETGKNPLLDATATNGQVDIATDTGDLDLGTVLGGSEVNLWSSTGSLSAQQLTSTDAGINATGQDDATFDNVQAAGGVVLNATTGALTTTGTVDSTGTAAIGSINSSDDVDLNGATGVAIGGDVTDGGGNINVTLTNLTGTGTLEIGNGVSLDATGNVAVNAQQAGDAVQMGNGSVIDATGTAMVDAGGNVLLGLVQSTDASDDPAIGIIAGGSIQGNGDPLNVQERAGGSVALQSVDDIGSATLPLVVDVNTLSADSTQGSIYLDALGDITATSLTSAGDTALQAAQDATVQQATVGGNLSIASTNGAVTLTQGTVGGASTLDAATNVTVGMLQGGNGLTTQSGDATTLGTVTLSGGNLQSTAGTTLAAQQIDVQAGNATLASTGDMTLGSVTTSGDLDATAGTNLTAATLSSGGATSLTATNGELQVTNSLTSGGDTALQSGGDTDIAALTVGGNLTADSGGSIDVAQGTVTGTGNLDAADNLTLGTWNEANDLITQSGEATSFGDVTLTGGNLQSTAGTTLAAQQIDVQDGNATLASTGDMTLGSLTTSGDLDATAGTNLTAATLSSGGATSLTATNGELQVTSSLTSGGDTALQSGGDTDIAALTVGGNLTANSGGSIDVTQGTVTGTGNLDAADNLTLGTWNEANDLTTQSGEATSFGDVTLSGGNLQSMAGTTLAAQQIDVQDGNATLASTGDMTLGSVTTSGDLGATAGGNLQATTLQSGGDTTLQSAQAMTLGTASAGGNLDATAGTDLTAATLSSGGSTSLTATNGELQVTSSLTSGGDTALQSGGDTDIAALTVGGNLTANSGGSIDVTQGTVTGTGNLDAADNLTLGTWNEANDLTTQSGEATSFGDVTLSGGNLQSTAGTTLAAQQIDVQAGNATLASTGDMTLGSVTTSGGLDATSGGNLQATTLQSGGDTTLQSAQAMTLGTANSGGSVDATAGTDFAATTIDAATDVDIKAGGTVQTTQVQAGHDVDVNAGGNVGMVTTTAGHDIDVDSGGALTMHDATAGDAVSLAAQSMTFDDVQAPNTITLLARDGNILAGSLTTRDAYAEANGDIVLDASYIGDRINLGANDITAYVKQTSTGQPLYSDLTGYQGSVANRITVDADASQRWMIDRLAAVQAALTTSAPNADIASGTIMKTMALDTSKARVRMNQQSPLLVLADVQLMQPTYDFQLYQDGIHTLTDAFVIRYGYGFQIETPNYVADHAWMDPDYLGESALRNNGRFLDTDDESDDNSSGQTGRAIPHWIRTNKDSLVQPAPSSDSVDVNLQAPE